MGQENSVSISSIEVGYDCVLVYVWGRYVYVSVSAYVWEGTCMYEWRYMSGDQKRMSVSLELELETFGSIAHNSN